MDVADEQHRTAMGAALVLAAAARPWTSPNPWVGAVVLSAGGEIVGRGATEPPGGPHAEVVALQAAGEAARGGTLVVTLEPCAHHGRTPPCVEVIVRAGVAHVVVAVTDPDPKVAGRGIDGLRAAGIDVTVGVLAAEAGAQLAAYLHHRTTGRPFVVCKLAITIDGAIAASDGSSTWITGEAARADVHRLRAASDAILVGAATVRTDDPQLTVRGADGRDPLRVVLGTAPPGARVHPCLEWQGDPADLLDDLGGRGVLQLLVEGGARTVRTFLDADLIDRFVVYVAPCLLAGTDKVPMVGGPSAISLGEAWRGRFADVRCVGEDLRIELIPPSRR